MANSLRLNNGWSSSTLPFGACSFFLLIFCLNGTLLHAADTVTADQPLSGDQKLISQGGKFAAGFFQPAGGSRDKWFLGIWYNKISKQTPVWIANRQTPISDPTSSQLTISADGNMVLLNHFKSPIWSTNATNIASNSTVAVMLDNGNLVLAYASNTSNVLWQSSDEPTNTWLPGTKLLRNKVTGVSYSLVSWKSATDPSPGLFSIEMDPNGSNQYVLEWNNSEQYWASGNWTGHMFSGILEMASTTTYPNTMYSFQYIDNDRESSFVFTIKDDAFLAMFVMNVAGQVQGVTWVESAQDWMPFWANPKAQCDVYFVCGPFSVCTDNAFTFCNCLRGFSRRQYTDGHWEFGSSSAGCTRNVALQCGGNDGMNNAKKDGFYEITGINLPDNARSVVASSAHDCELACLSNCSCTAYSYSDGCSLWYGDLINLQNQVDPSVGRSICIRLAASEFSTSKSHKTLIIGIVVGGVVLITAFVVITSLFISRNMRIRRLKRVGGSLVAFKYRDLQYVTKNFSEKLGGGSFGSVFKGLLPGGTVVAVKKLEGVHQGEKQFRAEVSTIGTIQHVNLIRLLGFCSEGARKMLVYEYMSNGSLDQHLFKSNSDILSWSIRYQIALGIAKGLAYMHEKCRDCIIHCDVKPENVLLDASFMPKVADFGLAKLVGRDFSRVLTTMRGTVGYLAPEWITGMAITAKADVFSYGMVLLEIISGRRNTGDREQSVFPLVVARKLPAGDVLTLLDSKLAGDANSEELERACKVALWCVQDDENSRPTMGEIVQILEGLVDVNMPPVPRYLQVLTERPNYLKFFSDEPPTYFD